jgi:hypothetical protein
MISMAGDSHIENANVYLESDKLLAAVAIMFPKFMVIQTGVWEALEVYKFYSSKVLYFHFEKTKNITSIFWMAATNTF